MVDRTLDQTVRRMLARITLLERRMGKRSAGLPARLSPTGEEVTNWNDATEVGFYWANGALNSPPNLVGASVGYWVGEVLHLTAVDDSPRILQTLWRPDVPNGPRAQRSFTSGGTWSAWTTVEFGMGTTASLGTTDLNTILQPGTYVQTSNANVTLARNYPIANRAGNLTVTQGNIFATQTYTDYQSRDQWVRTYYNGSFFPWLRTGSQAVPDPVYAVGPTSNTITGGAGSWQAISGASITIPSQTRDLWVDVQASAIVKASSGYTMLGVNITGGLVLGPDFLPDGTAYSGATPFSSSTVDTAISMHSKRVLLPAGASTSFALWARRSVGTASATCNYPVLSVQPLRWV